MAKLIDSKRGEIRTLGIDPGRLTGYSDGTIYGEEPQLVFLFLLQTMLVENRYDRIAIERFHIRKITEDTTKTVEQIGAIKWIAVSHKIPFGQVEASAKKKTLQNVAKNVKYFGKGHACDAEAIRLWDLEYGRW